MRFRSASKRARSKYLFFDQGRKPLSLVASALFNTDSSTALTPLNERLWTWTVPSSLQAAAVRARAKSTEKETRPRIRSRWNHNACHMRGVGLVGLEGLV